MKKNLISLLMIAVIALFTACNNDDDNGGGTNPPGPQKDGLITSQDDPDLDPMALTGDVEADVTLSSAQTWNLTGPLSVKEGFTLTIEAGTRIEATAGGTNVYVVVEQGAQIDAVGTASQPITFTSAADNPRAGDWGGILLNGRAPISGGGTSTTEVLPLSYGGTDDADNSGIMDYVIIEYTGARINGEQEFNGLSLYAVGNSTQISNIVINKGDDDAIEWFGGTVTVDNLLIVDARDDMFDWTQGWRSIGGDVNTNWYGVRTFGFTAITEDPRGIEGDGNLDGDSPSDDNQSNPTIENITIVNNGIINMSDMVKIRRGSSATITGLHIAFNLNNPDEEDANPSASDTIDLNDGNGNALASTSITGTVDTASGVDINEIENAAGATVNLSVSTTPSVDASIFSWAGINF